MPVKKPEPKDYQRRMFYVVVDCVDPKDDYIEEVETVGPFVASVLVKARISKGKKVRAVLSKKPTKVPSRKKRKK